MAAPSNTLNNYDPLFYAQQALRILKNSLGLAGRVYRGYDRNTQVPGSTISIATPQEFTAGAAPKASVNLAPGEVQIVLDQWREVKFKMTDKDLSLSRPQIITDHIEPAVYALMDEMDVSLASTMYQSSGWEGDASSPAAIADVVGRRTQLFDNKCNMKDRERYFMVDGTIGGELLQLSAFTQYQGSGSDGQSAQKTGDLGYRYGFNIFENQNVQTHTGGAAVPGATLQINAAAAVGATSVVFKDSGGSLTGDVHAGDFFTIAGDTQAYAITAQANAAANLITASISPALKVAVSGSEVVTLTQNTGDIQLAFHRNSTALAMAPLSRAGAELGAQIEVATDPQTGLSVRARRYYIGDDSTVAFAFDVLYGIKVLRPNLITRLRNA